MWILDAWSWAEVVWYSLVWEKEKHSENVIDYHIREEQTKDAFNVENANNQTTTGMATIIPWINAPKLIAKTSIIWDLWWSGTTLVWDTTIDLSTDIAVEPWNNWTFNTSTISDWGEWWSISSYIATPLPWWYYMRWKVETNNLYRYIDMFWLTVSRNWNTITVWNEWNWQMTYSWATAFVFEEWDNLRLTYRFTWWSANAATSGTIEFIRFR